MVLTMVLGAATPQPHSCASSDCPLADLLGPKLLQGYNSDWDLEILGPFRISFRLSSFFRRFSSSLKAFWKGSVLGMNCEMSRLDLV